MSPRPASSAPPAKTPAPFDAPDFRYAKLRAAQAHFARLERPIGTAASGGPLAVLELHYDLATLDVASQREQRTIAAIAVLGAITVSLLSPSCSPTPS